MDFVKVIQTQEGEHSVDLNLSFLKPGIYYISLTGNGQEKSIKKLVVK